MHDVRVPLDRHEIGHLHGAVIDDAADVVAREVDEHQVLRALFGIGEQELRVAVVLLVGFAAADRAGDRADLDLAVHRADVDLRRRADDREAPAEFQAEHVRRRIHEAQRAVERQRIARVRRRETLRRHELENVAGADELLPRADHLHVLLARRVAGELRVLRARRLLGGDGRQIGGLAQPLDDRANARSASAYAASVLPSRTSALLRMRSPRVR